MSEIKFYGSQNLTLLDYPGHMACILFTCGCNMHCPYCHNKSLVQPELFPKEIFVWDLLEKRKNILDGVVISGGEPLLYETEDVLRRIKDMGYLIKLDTNGTSPEKLERLIKNGFVDYVAMDVKHIPEKYNLATGVNTDMTAIQRSMDLLMSGSVDYEFRTTVVRGIHTGADIVKLAEWIKGAKHYYLQQYRNPKILCDESLSAFSDEEMIAILKVVQTVNPNAELRGVEMR